MDVWPALLSALPLGFSRPEHDSWFRTHSPLPVILLFVFCLLLRVAGPHIMSQLEPLRLAGSLATYNLGCAVLSGYIFHEVRLVGALQCSRVSSFLGCSGDK